MRQAQRLAAAAATALVFSGLLAACGGGSSSSSSATTNARNFAAGGSDVVPMKVVPGPADANDLTFNIPYVTVTVCQGGTCATIPDVLVDSASYGLRLIASAVRDAGLTPSPAPDPGNPSNTLAECLQFADGYTWGPVTNLSVIIGNESTATAIPVQIIDDSQPAPPSGCASAGGSMNTVDDFDANGVLGVGPFTQDCGEDCAIYSNTDMYWSCPPSGPDTSCTAIALPLYDQVVNPVARFQADNNGVVLQLPAISASGAPSASGYLVFGIGTESNNGLGGATVLTTDSEGDFITNFAGQTLSGSFIDSGSNSLYLPNPNDQLALCGGEAADFYCPNPTANLSATLQGHDGAELPVSFQVADIDNISTMDFAVDDVGGPATPLPTIGPYFDWGLPFFYGRTIYVGIDGTSAGGHSGPFYAVQ